MAQESVHCSGQINASASVVWSLVRNFHGRWHPAINKMAIETDHAGRLIRAFTVHGDDATYRERLTWFSDSEQSMAYTHIEGIKDVHNYRACLDVSAISESTCTVTMTAQLMAAPTRAKEIANGTKAIFDEAIATIQTLASSATGAANGAANGAADSATTNNTASTDASTGTPKVLASVNNPALPHTSHINQSLAVSSLVGPSTDTLCLFLHGIGGNRRNWDRQLQAVSTVCQAAAMDLRGYGGSTPVTRQSTVDDYCADISSVAQAMGAKKLILCGLSYGAWIATSFAMRYPQRLSALVLSGGCTGMSEASEKERQAFRLSREVPLNEGKTPADFAASVVDKLVGKHCADNVKTELIKSMEAISSATYADALRCFTNPNETFDFSRLTMPVLLMTGTEDKLAPPAEISRVAQRIVNASRKADVRYECLSDAGHVCNLEAPDAYNAPLMELVHRVVA